MFMIIIIIRNNTGDNKILLYMPGFHAKGVMTVTLLLLLVMFLALNPWHHKRRFGKETA